VTVRQYPLLLATLLASASFGDSVQANPHAVIELFTSQGCSSCPPADRLFAELARDPRIITLSLPVDYWDRLGWKDTFAKHTFTERQAAYSSVRGDGEVYTPQAVVNGTAHTVGSQRAAIDAAVAASAASFPVSLSVERAGDHIAISVGGATPESTGTIVLVPFLAAREVRVGRGENADSTVTYTNIARDLVEAGTWAGAPVTLSVPLKGYESYDGVVVMLQSGSTGRPGAILGAARTIFR
jgi:hypothetical protein